MIIEVGFSDHAARIVVFQGMAGEAIRPDGLLAFQYVILHDQVIFFRESLNHFSLRQG